MTATPPTPTAQAQLLLLDTHQVSALLQPQDVLRAVHEAFTLHSQRAGRVFPVVREVLATGGVFGIKSGDVAAQNLLGFKAAGFWPANRPRGGEPHQATRLRWRVISGTLLRKARDIAPAVRCRDDGVQICFVRW